MALLQLAAPSTKQPISLVNKADAAEVETGWTAHVLGYSDPENPGRLRMLPQKVKSRGETKRCYLRKHLAFEVQASEFGAGDGGSERPIGSDSGGPLITATRDGTWKVAGVLSGGSNGCPDLYSDVGPGGPLRRWIDHVAQRGAAEVIVPYGAAAWSYSVDGGGHRAGTAAFGSGGYCAVQDRVVTAWPVDSRIEIARDVLLPRGTSLATVRVVVDNAVEVYWNGILVGSRRNECPHVLQAEVVGELVDAPRPRGVRRVREPGHGFASIHPRTAGG